ncbi:hypothetical protein [Tenacibaculum sp. M341]|uniref:hypothetical protein n=1 Tax=Tenacibaculum sp. M341 TaxID=2530339 RepID=UPI00104EA3D2|nr:hypothetical protein [Tenacibaculum sp. M341]TCI92134.1 hypothetical protein EYW44_08090 [Tenacibaculum sp. M341]
MLANQHISNTENIFSFKKSIVSNYTFFDGKSEFEVVNNYSDWLSSTDYLDYSKSFVNIGNTKIHLFGESRKALNSSNFNRSVLMRLAHLFDLKSEVTDKECKIYHEKYRYDNYYLVS